MTLGATAPLSVDSRLLVRTLRVDVVEGPDAGLRSEAESDILTLGTADTNVVTLTDSTVSRFHAELTRQDSGVQITDLGSTNGTFVSDLRVQRGVASPPFVLRIGRTLLRISDGAGATEPVASDGEIASICGRSPAMRRLQARVQRVALSNVPTLLLGESGTGKEVIAHAIHQLSDRSEHPFITLDCGALTPSLVASELFGHERGSFTGAERRHEGVFERAKAGTVFLDEIGELPLEIQSQLLGALERRQFRRVGGKDELRIDARVLAATHRDLRAEVNQGKFRLDLYYRLAVVLMTLPPLRERPEDIPLLVAHFLREAGHEGTVASVFTHEQMEDLKVHHWPGNVRELRNWVDATLAVGESPELHARQVAESAVPGPPIEILQLGYREAREAVISRFERDYVANLLRQVGGNVAKAARVGHMDRSYLTKLVDKHRLR